MSVESRGTLGTVRNAMALLDLMSQGPAFRPLSELAEESGLTVPTVHRLLRSLVVAGLAEQEERTSRYGLGPELTRLSQRYLARLPILGALNPYLVALRDQIEATVTVAIMVRGSVVYVDRVDGHGGGLYRGSPATQPALETAAGRLLATASDTGWQEALQRADRELAALAESERDRWSKEDHLMLPGANPMTPAEIAVPVLNGSGNVAAALAAQVPNQQLEERCEAIIEQLHHVAEAAGRTLGRG